MHLKLLVTSEALKNSKRLVSPIETCPILHRDSKDPYYLSHTFTDWQLLTKEGIHNGGAINETDKLDIHQQ